ncbi:Nucleolar GTP-binding protein 1 like [Verticillium longisporum]|uniref:Nucleolar GTP-binding protein 1 like n=1 Tax=Verticillium longisporum TaxID=100787 RepID=A0A8I2ZC30_VERLO|nr:Nucleolar GTP-binding protein 1 like [Verticillium longisporum]
MKTQWKDIPVIPNYSQMTDIILSSTQRKLPTQIRAGFKISRIRGFYTRKVKFTQETCSDKLGQIIESFPRLNDIHPFHRDLMNTLYDADHLKIALGQISTCKSLIESVGRDYVRLLKYGQSLYQCKQLKRAALGRMATLIKRLKDTFLYLEQVRQHLGRLPSIDPNTRTLVICGFPNVGKSSFLKSVSRADVDVQPYAFTTKSLFCGHFDYKYLRFQCIDTPGILDHPLEEMSTIEMQSITALAHLRSAVMYFMDLSEQCGYSVEAQINLFASIKPLFSNKLVEDLDAETQEKLQGLLKSGEVEMLQLSCNTQEGVQDVKNAVCERLIAERVSQKLNAGTTSSGAIGGRLADVMSRIHVATPMGGQTLQTFIPEGIRNEARMKKRLKNQAIIPRKKVPIPLSKMDDALDQLGVDTTDIVSRARSQSRPRGRSLGRSRAGTEDADAMDLDATPRERLRSQSRARSRSQAAVNRREDGVEDEGSRTKAERMAKLGQKKMNRMARQGEADRHTTASLQRHLLAGKRGMGSTRSR